MIITRKTLAAAIREARDHERDTEARHAVYYARYGSNNDAPRAIAQVNAAARTREPLLARAYLDQLDEAAVQRERAEIAEAEVARLTERQQSHLETIRRITQTTPLDSEIATALEQRGALLAEVWTLRASRDQWSERYGADVAKLRAENAVMRTLLMSSVRPTSGQTWTEAQIHAAMYEPQGKVMP